jgi:2-dehydropantoate 2-reductase
MRFLVMGSGGIGGITTALLHESGQDVVAFTTNADIARAVNANGFQMRGDGAARTVRAPLVTRIPNERFDVIVLCTQPPQVESAAEMAKPALADDGVMVCLQNGLCESRVAAIVGPQRTAGAVVAWGAAMPEPGIYDRTAAGGFALGWFEEKSSRPLDHVARAFEAIGPVDTTNNLLGKRWSKLAINAAISSLGTVGGDRLGALTSHRFVRRLGLEIMTEAVHVARAEGVKLEKVSGTLDLDWIALTEEDATASGSPALVAKHGLLLAVGFRYRRMRSSMLAAIERGRTPAVDFLNGEIVERAKRHKIAAPVNERIHRYVWDIANKKRSTGLDTLRALYDETSPHGKE